MMKLTHRIWFKNFEISDFTSFNAAMNSFSVAIETFNSLFDSITDKNDLSQLSVYKEFETYDVLSSCRVNSSY